LGRKILLCRLWDDIGAEGHLDAASSPSTDGDVEENNRVRPMHTSPIKYHAEDGRSREKGSHFGEDFMDLRNPLYERWCDATCSRIIFEWRCQATIFRRL